MPDFFISQSSFYTIFTTKKSRKNLSLEMLSHHTHIHKVRLQMARIRSTQRLNSVCFTVANFTRMKGRELLYCYCCCCCCNNDIGLEDTLVTRMLKTFFLSTTAVNAFKRLQDKHVQSNENRPCVI